MPIFRREAAVRYHIDHPMVRVQPQGKASYKEAVLVCYQPHLGNESEESVCIMIPSQWEGWKLEPGPGIEQIGNEFVCISVEMIHPEDLAELRQHYKDTRVPFYAETLDPEGKVIPPHVEWARVYTGEQWMERLEEINALTGPEF